MKITITNRISHSFFILSIICISLLSCKRRDHSPTDKKYKLGVQSQSNSTFYYTITNETSSNFEVNGKEIENKNNSDMGLVYNVQPADSNGNTAIKITFDKFHIALKNQENEKELDADNGVNSADPVENFLGKIKGSSIQAVINKNGEVSSANETKNFIDSLVSSIIIQDQKMKDQLKEQLSQLMGEGFIKNNLENFHIFPDTAVYVGDSWTKKNSTSASNMTLEGVTKYTLTSISNGVANIETDTRISNVSNNENKSLNNINADLKGTQEGEFEVDTQTGMLLNGKSSATIKGSLQLMGREVPITIKMKRKVEGKKM